MDLNRLGQGWVVGGELGRLFAQERLVIKSSLDESGGLFELDALFRVAWEVSKRSKVDLDSEPSFLVRVQDGLIGISLREGQSLSLLPPGNSLGGSGSEWDLVVELVVSMEGLIWEIEAPLLDSVGCL